MICLSFCFSPLSHTFKDKEDKERNPRFFSFSLLFSIISLVLILLIILISSAAVKSELFPPLASGTGETIARARTKNSESEPQFSHVVNSSLSQLVAR